MTKETGSGVQIVGGQQRMHMSREFSWGEFCKELNLAIVIPCALILIYLVTHVCFPKMLWYLPEYQASKNARAIDAAVEQYAAMMQQTVQVNLQEGDTVTCKKLIESGFLTEMPKEPQGCLYGTYGPDKKFKSNLFAVKTRTKYKVSKVKKSDRPTYQEVENVEDLGDGY